jgi:hypothetical protein
MGTISDKLMRIINTKEDIRQALISKGYDVPTSIPFKEYAKMISDLPCRVDSFPDIEGIVARYSALGLTNEQMAANPVWADKTGNDHDLQMKNFAWGGMSGVGGYGDENHLTFYKFTFDDYVFIAIKAGVKHMNFTFRVTGLQPGNKLTLAFFGTTNTVYGTWNKDGIYTVNSAVVEVGKPVYFYNGYGSTRGEFTIEILPLYPGALVFDGVDDYGVCDNFPILTKEKGYTVVVLRQWITYNPNAISAIATNASDQSFNGAFTFENYNKGAEQTISYGATQITLQYSKSPFSWQTTSKYNGVNIANGNKDATNSLVLGRSYPQRNEFANFAIWELVFLDHDATEEELTKIKDYFVKTYPWLFFDQAWTVTGKTNEDEDRATIANITGNGNDLVLSNVAFSENSGYGSYPFGMNVWNPDYIADQPYGTVHYPNDSKSYATTVKNNATNFRIKFRLRGLPEGGSFLIRVFDMNDLNTVLKTYTYTENGIHEFVYNDPNKPARIILYNGNTPSNISEFYLDIIPEYEGYLVTDGVDDKIVSSVFEMGKDFAIVGDWKFIDNKKSGTGLVKVSSFYIYNTMIGLDLYINSGSVKNSLDGIKSINAACSDGRAYDRNWNEILANTGNVVGSGSMLEVSSSGGRFDLIAFKNLAIYPRILSKDDCIKAYNYLQTLKAK